MCGQAVPTRRPRTWRPENVPLPEQHLAAIALAVWLQHRYPVRVPGPSAPRRFVGAFLSAAGLVEIAAATAAAGGSSMAQGNTLVTRGAYAASRNPMYLGWAALHLGTGLAIGSAWAVGGVAIASACIHRQVLGEERLLEARFADAYVRYRSRVPRYLPRPSLCSLRS